ncbi:electromotor neuron-associated protein 1-like isoform X2 [Pyrgilauda ruficollis]|uniref:electromotor neuron-associated protein 1-like isoform X2 n=1 Tax=Pyrgilauda ruficollis TaxID=221976 RepID=UPI001B87B231|nr:electromotor neuron-associated protein 1-like isoform X2 [Pyrgilauda ruficollis]
MATVVVVEMDSEASCSIPNPTFLSPSLSHRFLDRKFYLLVVIGELVTEEHLRRAIANIERGIRSWDTSLIGCNLDQELKLFVSRHSARFSPDIQGRQEELPLPFYPWCGCLGAARQARLTAGRAEIVAAMVLHHPWKKLCSVYAGCCILCLQDWL